MKKSKTQKGITLIALIITIVVLLILAVVAIRAVQGDGVIQYAQNARDEYTSKANEEQETINGYISQIEEGLSGEKKITWIKTSEGDLAVGSTVATNTGENFYVIGFKDNNETVQLLAKECIAVDEEDENYLKQSSSAERVSFCEDSVGGYWKNSGNIKEEQPILSTHIAAYAAHKYGAILGGTGRIMLYSEANALKSTNSDIIFGENRQYENSGYWLGTAFDSSYIRAVGGGTLFGRAPL